MNSVPSAGLALPRPLQSSVATPSLMHETAADWAHEGKKIGGLAGMAAVAHGSVMAYAHAMHALGATPALKLALGPGAIVGTLVLGVLEEQYLGIGKRLGAALAGGMGAAVGLFRKPPKPAPETIELPRREPTGKPPNESIFPTLLHSAERHLLGHVPERTASVESCEALGSTLSGVVWAYALPKLVTMAVGGPVGTVMSTLAGPMIGLIAGQVIENAFGIGRAAGELLGHVVHMPEPQPKDPAAQDGRFKKAFFEANHFIGEPLVGFLVDGATVTDRLFQERPWQTMPFTRRPTPHVDPQRVADEFVHLASIPGKSGNEPAIGAEIRRQLGALGIVSETRVDGTILARIAATPGCEDVPTLMFSAHQDTVEPTSPESIVREPDRIHTDETHILGADDRAGITEILHGVKTVVDDKTPHGPLVLVFPVQEETGLGGSSALKPEDISNRPTLGYVMDALDVRDVYLTDDAVIVSPKSIKYEFSQEDPLVQLLFAAMADSGCKPRPMHVGIMPGAGSDANTTAYNSGPIRSLAVGAGERDIHSSLENIKVADLAQATRHVIGLITHSLDLRVDGDRIVKR
ncbi:MAG: M20/M25/M40 family metallo-hydrolase [Candidatus Xenobia bacterium]